MLMKYQDGKFYPEFSINAPFILKVWMVMFSLTYPPWFSITENKLKIFIAKFSDFNRKLSSLEKVSLLQYFSSSTWRYCQRAKELNNSLRPRWQISSNSFTTMDNLLSAQYSDKLKAFIAPKSKYLITFLDNNGKSAVYTGLIFMDSIVI